MFSAWRLILCILLLPEFAAARIDRDRGWGDLIDRLAADGVDRDRAVAVFRDRRVAPFTRLEFTLDPREPRWRYRKFRSSGSIARARRCRTRYGREFRAAERRFGVPAHVLSAILYVETQCGEFTGKSIVLYRLARLAMADAPANVRHNIREHTRGLPARHAAEVERKVRRRARQLEEMFYPEVVATFRLAEKLQIDPLGIRGSPSGAFGLPQFLPSSYLRFGVDANKDARVSLHDPADAVASAANYLVGHGWRPGVTRVEQRRVLWHYNHSESYIETVLFLADRVAEAHPPGS